MPFVFCVFAARIRNAAIFILYFFPLESTAWRTGLRSGTEANRLKSLPMPSVKRSRATVQTTNPDKKQRYSIL